jgi:hypothetical protein
MPLDCTGENLPDIPTIEIPNSPTSFDDFCLVLNAPAQVLLHESISNKNKTLKYWVILEADDYPLAACELEQYADYAAQQQNWEGKRSDYLLIGSHQGDCYLIIIELRHVIVKEEHEDQKFEQLRQCIEQLINQLFVIDQSNVLTEVYPNPEQYKIIGVVIAPGNTRQFRRGELNLKIEIKSHPGLIRTLPKDALSQCQITWTELLHRVGIPRNPRTG